MLGVCEAMCPRGTVEYRYDIEPSIWPKVDRVYEEAKLGVLRDDTCRASVDGVWKESNASEVAVKEE